MNKLLSICIPTYNRAQVLDATLFKLFSNPDFDEDLIEVIVCDNCSTDHTAEVVAKYPSIRYYCNSENVRDLNFSIALGYANASYVRLFNDTLSFLPGALSTMLQRIEQHMLSNQNLFFYTNMFLHENSEVILNTSKDYILNASFFSTWIANFGCWTLDFKSLADKDKYAHLQLTQVDWNYQIVKNGKSTIIYFDKMFLVETPSKKGGYNLFHTFVNNYLSIIKGESFTLLTYETEKYRLCRYFLYPWLVTLKVKSSDDYSYDTSGLFQIILKKYWYEPYVYLMFIIVFIRKCFRW